MVWCSPECSTADAGAHTFFCLEQVQLRSAAVTTPPTLYPGGADLFSDLGELQRGAAAGDPVALVNLGAAHHTGKAGLTPDASKAAALYKLAVSGGSAPKEAYHNLGRCYWVGSGVQHDPFEAVRLFRLGAAAGHTLSQFMLGLALQEGRGVAVDAVEGYRMLCAAADGGYAPALSNVGFALCSGHGCHESKEAGVAAYRRGAEMGETQCMYNLAGCYLSGEGVGNRNSAEAVMWMQRAAGAGHAFAERRLAECCALTPGQRSASGFPRTIRGEGGEGRKVG